MSTKHRAFFASPFKDEYRWIRNAITAACRELDIDFRAVDETVKPGSSIIDAIHDEIARATISFVVISDLNPNVMYELGLLHASSKPTIMLADKPTTAQLPFDIRSLMVVRYDATKRNEQELRVVVMAAAARMLKLLDEPSSRAAVAAGHVEQVAGSSLATAQLSVGRYDFESLKDRAARSAGRKNCETRNISEFDDGTIKGWRLKAKCSGGCTMSVVIDVNGDIREVDID